MLHWFPLVILVHNIKVVISYDFLETFTKHFKQETVASSLLLTNIFSLSERVLMVTGGYSSRGIVLTSQNVSGISLIRKQTISMFTFCCGVVHVVREWASTKYHKPLDMSQIFYLLLFSMAGTLHPVQSKSAQYKKSYMYCEQN